MYINIQNHKQPSCSFIKCFKDSIDPPKWAIHKNQPLHLTPKLKKSLSGKKNKLTRGRQTSEKRTKTQIKQQIQKNSLKKQQNQKKRQIYQSYYNNSFVQKNSCIINNQDRGNYHPALQKLEIDSPTKKIQNSLSSKQINFIYSPSMESMMTINSKINTSIKTSLQNIELSTYLTQTQIPLFSKNKKEKMRKKQVQNQKDFYQQNLVNKEEIIKPKKINYKKNEQILIKMFEQDQKNNQLLSPQNKIKNSVKSWQFNSNTNLTSNLNISEDLLQKKLVYSMIDSDQIQNQQESFVLNIHGPHQGHIVSLFQM